MITDYSQHGEQEIISAFFDQHEPFVPVLLDIGANDGITFSNSRYLMQKGWKGFLVEPSPKAFDRLKKNYEHNDNATLVNYGIGTFNGKTHFFESGDLTGNGDVSLVSSVKETELKRWQTINGPGQKIVNFDRIEIFVLTYAEMKKLFGFNYFDFVTIDIEGMELDILPQLDFNEMKTKMVIIENNGKDEQKFHDIIKPFGFELTGKNKANLIYTRY